MTGFSATNRRLSKDAIAEFARSQNIHPGIIVGRLQKIGKVPYQHHRNFLVNLKQYLSECNDGDSITQLILRSTNKNEK